MPMIQRMIFMNSSRVWSVRGKGCARPATRAGSTGDGTHGFFRLILQPWLSCFSFSSNAMGDLKHNAPKLGVVKPAFFATSIANDQQL